jgi:hypothetical protein
LKCSSKNFQIADALSDVEADIICQIIEGNVIKEIAKMIGTIQAWFTLIGK